jgi:hypothetical protein
MQDNLTDAFVAELRKNGRVLVLGGGAVIALGLDRRTKDADVWLEPGASPEAWSNAVRQTLASFPTARLTRLFPPRDIHSDELTAAIKEDRVIRIMGLEKPLDLFREPNNLEDLLFEDAWQRSEPFHGDVRSLSPSVLLVTKEGTGRERDQGDIIFLRSVLHQRMIPELQICGLARAEELLSDYMDYTVLAAALDNPDEDVQALGKLHLRTFAEEGDPFAIDAWTARFGPL